jgi:tripartite-type tricarboxylate transporter receptor subunit TctC
MKRLFLRGAWAVGLCLPMLCLAAWPEKPIRVVVPYAAGGGADNTARLIVQHMSTSLGQQIIIDNKPGAGGVIGADAVAKSPADGYTILFDASAFSVNPSLRKLPFNPATDFIPISLVVSSPQIFAVHPSAPFNTVAEFVDHARKNPNTLTFASAGGGAASHLAGEALNSQGKLTLVHVPYKGGAPAITDLMAQQVTLYFGNVASTLGHVKSGKLKALAVSSSKRVAQLPDTPTLNESGFPGFNVVEWNGVFLPKGVAPDIVARLSKVVQEAVNDAKVKEKLLGLGLDPVGGTSNEFAKFVELETARIAALVKERNIRVD